MAITLSLNKAFDNGNLVVVFITKGLWGSFGFKEGNYDYHFHFPLMKRVPFTYEAQDKLFSNSDLIRIGYAHQSLDLSNFHPRITTLWSLIFLEIDIALNL
ncbi:hypothetical protein VNO77_44776 [Canavalia gladiata]|uniref:Uncharacterized protein n=1 Tax=Canavalia gladiata TaxID=3824 RepID=A0AAN9JZJ3_CANGL